MARNRLPAASTTLTASVTFSFEPRLINRRAAAFSGTFTVTARPPTSFTRTVRSLLPRNVGLMVPVQLRSLPGQVSRIDADTYDEERAERYARREGFY